MDGHAPYPVSPVSRSTPSPGYLPDHPRFAALERLEGEITELWGHINAATYRFLKLVVEFDAQEGWGRHGCASCAQWLNWQCGIGTVAAREKVRVARALQELPLLSEAFARGELSYSKIRAVTRVATPENEGALLNIALHGTASHVERLVRRFRKTEQLEAAFVANEQHRERYLHYRHDDDGSMIIQARLPAETGAMLLKALETAENALFDEQRALDHDVSAETEIPSQERVAERDEDTAPARRVDALCHLAEQYLGRKSVDTTGADRFQVVVHVDQAVLSTTDHESGPAGVRPIPPAPQRCELESGPTLAVETARRLACDAPLVGILEREGDPLSVGRKTRSIAPALKRALRSRDGGCRFPGCGRTRFTEGHHVKHWADGGETRLSNLITLCRFHHRLIHEGGFGLRATDDGLFVFSRPDGSRIGAAGRFRGNISADSSRPLPLMRMHEASGLRIDRHTARSRWQGEPMDYGLALEGLWALRGPG